MAIPATFPAHRWVKRLALRPARSGHPRRKPKGFTCSRGAQRSAEPRREPRSLDSCQTSVLATSVREWLKETETAWDKRQRLVFLNGRLLRSIVQKHDQLAGQMWDLAEDREPGQKIDAEIKELGQRIERLAKDYSRISNCQKEWIGFRATCCHDELAVPVGCNHRLCNLCNGHRAEKYRERVRFMFDRLSHPIFLTLTVPNVKRVSKRTYNKIRIAARKLIKQHKGWMKGGLYSLETTYNRKPEAAGYGRWHVHLHILIDSAFAIPRSKPRFVAFKRRIEFDWLLLTGGRKHGWRASDFDYWFHATNRKSAGHSHNLGGAENRRIVDVRRVTDRQKAAWEVLKYITKSSDFADVPDAVEEFMRATRGTRMLQTFGSWYGFKFPEDVNSWAHLNCRCGENKFQSMGRLFACDVEMRNDGRYRPKPRAVGMGPPMGNKKPIQIQESKANGFQNVEKKFGQD